MNDNLSAFNSGEYDRQIKCTIPYYEEFYRQTVETVQAYFKEPIKWLDGGCGTGKMAEAAAKEVELEKFVFCDASDEMIEIARNRLDLPGAEYIISDVRKLNFKNEFDVVTAIQVNHYLTREERSEAFRVYYDALKCGGMFINFENFAPQSEVAEKLYLDRWQSWQQKMGKSPKDCRKHRERYKKDYYPITVPDNQAMMRKCGFKVVEILWLSGMQVGILGIK